MDNEFEDDEDRPETFKEFVRRMGCKPLEVGGRWLFPNGAQSTGKLDDHYPPPKDPANLIPLKIEYARFQCQKLLQHYNEIRQNCISQTELYNTGHGPRPNFEKDREVLTALIGEINTLKKQLEEMGSQLPQSDSRRYAARMERERRQEAHGMLTLLQQLPAYR